MCVIKIHAFIYFLRPPPWYGTILILDTSHTLLEVTRNEQMTLNLRSFTFYKDFEHMSCGIKPGTNDNVTFETYIVILHKNFNTWIALETRYIAVTEEYREIMKSCSVAKKEIHLYSRKLEVIWELIRGETVVIDKACQLFHRHSAGDTACGETTDNILWGWLASADLLTADLAQLTWHSWPGTADLLTADLAQLISLRVSGKFQKSIPVK
jgi:hypothetical protein